MIFLLIFKNTIRSGSRMRQPARRYLISSGILWVVDRYFKYGFAKLIIICEISIAIWLD
jgi:hypothetical protein